MLSANVAHVLGVDRDLMAFSAAGVQIPLPVPLSHRTTLEATIMSSLHRTLDGDVLIHHLDRDELTIDPALLARTGRSSRTLIKEGALRVVIMALAADGELPGHRTNRPVTRFMSLRGTCVSGPLAANTRWPPAMSWPSRPELNIRHIRTVDRYSCSRWYTSIPQRQTSMSGAGARRPFTQLDRRSLGRALSAGRHAGRAHGRVLLRGAARERATDLPA